MVMMSVDQQLCKLRCNTVDSLLCECGINRKTKCCVTTAHKTCYKMVRLRHDWSYQLQVKISVIELTQPWRAAWYTSIGGGLAHHVAIEKVATRSRKKLWFNGSHRRDVDEVSVDEFRAVNAISTEHVALFHSDNVFRYISSILRSLQCISNYVRILSYRSYS